MSHDKALSANEAFDFATARRLVPDLFEPRPWIYWTDLLTTIVLGNITFFLCRRLDAGLAVRAALFLATCILYFRAVNFIHEVVHLPARRFWLFQVVWNLLCGVPFLTPSFTHELHLEHHRRHVFGTAADGEYLALGRISRWWIALYLSQALWGPPLAIIRFGLLTPLSWLSPRIRDFVQRHCSSLVMDPRYRKPLPSPQKLFSIRIYETLCFSWIVGATIVGIRLGMERFLPFLATAYLLGATIIFMNCLRTMGAHRWRGAGAESSLTEQLLDSVNIDSRWPWDVVVAPVGLRFHATHHLFPGIPYHNLPAAHRRLQRELPADSVYHQTTERSLFGAIYKLMQRAPTLKPDAQAKERCDEPALRAGPSLARQA